MIKTFENFISEEDPYGEEDWNDLDSKLKEEFENSEEIDIYNYTEDFLKHTMGFPEYVTKDGDRVILILYRYFNKLKKGTVLKGIFDRKLLTVGKHDILEIYKDFYFPIKPDSTDAWIEQAMVCPLPCGVIINNLKKDD